MCLSDPRCFVALFVGLLRLALAGGEAATVEAGAIGIGASGRSPPRDVTFVRKILKLTPCQPVAQTRVRDMNEG